MFGGFGRFLVPLPQQKYFRFFVYTQELLLHTFCLGLLSIEDLRFRPTGATSESDTPYWITTGAFVASFAFTLFELLCILLSETGICLCTKRTVFFRSEERVRDQIRLGSLAGLLTSFTVAAAFYFNSEEACQLGRFRDDHSCKSCPDYLDVLCIDCTSANECILCRDGYYPETSVDG